VQRRHTEKLGGAGRDASSIELIGAFSMLIEDEVFLGCHASVENLAGFSKFQNFVSCVSLSSIVLALLCALDAWKHNVSRILIWKWRQQHVIDHTEDCRGCSNSESQRRD